MTNKTSWTGEVDLNPGDLIEIFRTGYQHWAVYVGLGNVVHLAPPSEYAGAGAASCKSLLADKALVKKEPLLDVVGGDRYCVSNKHDNKYSVRTPDQIVRLANDLEGKTMEYKVTSQNCEHFSNFLRYNVPQSDQVLDAVRLAIKAVLTAAALILIL